MRRMAAASPTTRAAFLYILTPQHAAGLRDLKEIFPRAVYDRLESGFIGFTFIGVRDERTFLHGPRRARAGQSRDAQLHPARLHAGGSDVSQHHHRVARDESGRQHVCRHKARASSRGSHRRQPHPSDGAVEFNPTARPGDPDYGLLYTSGSDHGFSNGAGPKANNPTQTQRLDSIITAILRIDPRSPSVTRGVKGLGDYTIPASNKFQADGDPKTLGEIYAYGFRNAHRIHGT